MKDFEDDGRTVADMNIEGTPWYRKNADKQSEDEDYSDLNLKKLILAAYKKYLLAAVLLAGICFLVLLAVDRLWLG